MQDDNPIMILSIARNGEEIGEWTLEQIYALCGVGHLLTTDLYWCQGMTEWLPLGSLMNAPLVSAESAEKTPPIVEQDLWREPLTAVEEMMAKIGPLPSGFEPAGFFRRCAARMIDYFILTSFITLILLPIMGAISSAWLFLLFILVVYYPTINMGFFVWEWNWLHFSGSSVGKWIYGLRVVNVDGTRKLLPPTATLRSHILLRSMWYMYGFPVLPVIRALKFDKQLLQTGTTPWDEVAGTVVVGTQIGFLRRVVAGLFVLISFFGICAWMTCIEQARNY